MHVGDINMWFEQKGPNVFVYTAVPILDASGGPVPEAAVSLRTTFPDSSTTSASATTDSAGVATFKVRAQQSGTCVSEVLNVSKEGWRYDPTANGERRETLVVP